ncbi:glycoside hydrolase family 5 protein [Hysterangium stoloniferum]|nr:glycoside hydrolase family 5 protein [Hysterangium stoloniferum]
MRVFAVAVAAACLVDSALATSWIPTRASQSVKRATPASNGFVTSQGTQLMLNGKPFNYVAANAYWLTQLNDVDINATVASIAAKNISVVRTWAFNDVTKIPDNGTWFQLLDPNGTTAINMGVNGIQRLDRIVDAVEANKMFVHFVLTNNWNPDPSDTDSVPSTNASNITFPRGSLSNDYGGADAYVRFFKAETHDTFFSNQTIISAFQKYIDVIVNRYKDRPAVLTWELANDPRCNSTLAAHSTCKTTTLTQWHSQVAKHVRALDPNHLVSSGTGGFQCVITSDPTKCPKLFNPPTAPPPQVSPAPGQKRTVPLTEKSILAERRARFKRTADALAHKRESAAEKLKRGAKTIWKYRGRDEKMISTRQATQNVGTAMDGSHGVDSQDILNIPEIGFSTFQLFPDQNTYEPSDPNSNVVDNTINTGVNWIQQQAQAATQANKPAILTGVGLVTQGNAPDFVPFDSSQPVFTNPASVTQIEQQPIPGAVGIGQGAAPVTDIQQQSIFQAWLGAAVNNDVSGISVYQWGQTGITAPTIGQGAAPPAANTFSPSLGQQNVSPNDGYQMYVIRVQFCRYR